MTRALNPADIRAQVTTLLTSHPELWDDAEGRELAVASETDGMDGIVARMLAAEEMVEDQTRLMQKLAARRDRYRARHEAMRQLAFAIMQLAELKKLELTQATLSIRQGQQKVIITDEAALPADYWRIKREPDKPIIKEHIQQGISVPGAALSNAEDVLNVRPT